MTVRRSPWFPALLFIALVFTPGFASGQRPVTVDDLLRLERLGETAVAPDGGSLAVVVQEASANIVPTRAGANGRAAIWLVPLLGGEPRRLTPASASDGYWSPAWSPDGRRLAAIVTSPSHGARLRVWERASGEWRDTPADDLDLDINFRLSGGFPPVRYLWVSHHTVLVAVRTSGGASLAVAENASAHPCPDSLLTSFGCPTVHVLSTAGGTAPLRGVRQLALVDVMHGTMSVLGVGDIRFVQVPPGGRFASVVSARDAPIVPRDSHALGAVSSELHLGVIELVPSPAASLQPVEDLTLTGSMVGTSIRWSPDGKRIAVVGRAAGEDGNALFVVDGAGRVVDRSSARWTIRNVAWLGDQPLALARPSGAPADADHRWRILAGDGDLTELATLGGRAPPFLMPAPHGLVGMAGGNLLLIDHRGRVSNLTEPLDAAVQRILWPEPYSRPGGTEEVVLATADGIRRRVDLRTATVEPLALTREQRLLAYAPGSGDWAAVTEHSVTPVLVAGHPGGSPRELLRLNSDFADVQLPVRRMLRFQGPSGDSLDALLLLPPLSEGRGPLPLIVSLYGGQVIRDLQPPGYTPTDWPANSLLPYAAAGYAVLVPTIPLPDPGSDVDLCAAVVRPVLSAVEAAVRSGVADPERIALHGHSFGGYNVYCVLRETDRFRAAVVLAGYADLASLYSAFSPADRWGEAPHRNYYLEQLAEGGQLRMEVPPWAAPDRYIHNSPLHQVDAIHTPVFIVHGELDYVPIQQAENVFKALNRLGREALLVRYRDEGHVIRSPANVLDLHARLSDWLAEHLGQPH